MKRLLSLVMVLLLLIVPVSVGASVLTDIQIGQVYQEEDKLYICFTASDEQDSYVSGLNKDQLEVTVAGKKLQTTISSLAETHSGTGYVLAVDISKSLNEKQFSILRSALNSWIDGLNQNDQVAVVTFGESITLNSDFVGDKTVLKNIINGLGPVDKKTQLYNGILRTLDIAGRKGDGIPQRRVIIVISDGMDDYPTGATVSEVQKGVEEANLPLYAVGIEGKQNKDQLNEFGSMARRSSGKMVVVSEDALGDGFAQIVAAINSGYVAQAQIKDSSLANGSTLGLILSVTRNGSTVEDSKDIRLKAYAEESAQPETPKPTQTAAAAATPAVQNVTPTPQATSVQEAPEEESKGNKGILWIALTVVVVGAVAAVVAVSLIKRNKARNEQQKIDDLRRRNDLDDLINNSDLLEDDRTVAMYATDEQDDNDKTTPLIGNHQRFMLSLEDVRSRGEKRYKAQLGGSIRVGRKAEQNDIAIADSSISGKHCVFEFRQSDNTLYLRDVGSTNGTYLVGKRGETRVDETGVQVKTGDVIRLGKTELSITIFRG